MPGSIFYLSWLQAKAHTKLSNRSFPFAPCFERINTKNRVFHHHSIPTTARSQPLPNVFRMEHAASPAAGEPVEPLPDECLHLIKPLKSWQPQLVRKDGLRSEPPSRRAHRQSLPPSFPSLPSPPFPSPLRRRGSDTTNYSFPTKEEREGDVVNSYTAGSFAFFANFPRD